MQRDYDWCIPIWPECDCAPVRPSMAKIRKQMSWPMTSTLKGQADHRSVALIVYSFQKYGRSRKCLWFVFFNEMKCLFIENKWFICKYVLLTAIFVNETRGNTIFYYKPVKFYSSHIINMTGHMTGHVFGHVICCFLKCIFKYCELFFDKS